MTVGIEQFLAEQAYFRDLSLETRRRIEGLARIRHLDRGEVLALEGDDCRFVGFVMMGHLRVTKSNLDGRQQVVHELTAGDGFYLVPALDGNVLPSSILAGTRAQVMTLGNETFHRVLRRYPELMEVILADFAQKLRQTTALVADLSLRTVPQRLAGFLLAQSEGAHPEGLTQREMATRLGTVREVISRTLSDFDEAGYVEVSRGRIVVRDGEGLRALAEGRR